VRDTISLFVVVLLLTGSFSLSAQEKTSGSVFGLTNLINVHLRVEASEWKKLQPPPGTKTGILAIMRALEDVLKDAAAGKHFWSDKSTRPGLAGYLGVDHQFGRAEATIDGGTVSGIGLRYKGNGTFLEGFNARKLSLKLDFGEYQKEQEFRGLTKLNLANCVTDPSMLREALSYEMFREAGIPSPRVGFARVSLTVPGDFEKKSCGLYTVVEQVDKRFLKDRYGSAEGLLLKPTTFGIFRYFGENWDDYVKPYVPKTDPTPAQQRRVIDFARLLNQADDAAFAQQVEEFLDMDEFLRFLAVNVLLCNLDSFLGGTQNHYVYLEPRSNKFQFLPWDMDHSFGAFGMEGTPDARRDLSIDRPGGNRNRLIERVLKIPRHKEKYHSYLAEYLDSIFTEAKMRRQISAAADFLRPLIHENGAKAPERFERVVADGPPEKEAHPMKFFVTKRRESVRQQLEGRSEGHAPFGGDLKILPIRKMLGFGAVLLLLLLLNGVGWLWGVVAGFRGSAGWGVLNLFFYPVTPMIYGFRVRQKLGRRCAWWVLISGLSVVTWIIAAVVMFK
jgi:spore coat protein H